MAAKTPDSIKSHNMGSENLVRVIFSDTNIDDADTWTSGMTNIVDFWAMGKNNPSTQGSAGIHISEASGVFTFYPGEDNWTGTLFIMKKG